MANKPVCEHEDVTVLWNKRVHTNREVTASKKEKTCLLIDVATPGDRNVTQKEAEKLSTGFMYRDKTYVEREMYHTGEIRAS